jgi:hypothetical protein
LLEKEGTIYEENSMENDEFFVSLTPSNHLYTEYWALIVAGGEYANNPEQNRPSMLEDAENVYNMLLVSEHWTSDHIKLVEGENATAVNIVKGLRWLDEMDDEDDICLLYITSHGGPGVDLPPFDEEDGDDEYLATYRSFEYPITLIWDDELNLLLSMLDSNGVCVIIDSCYSGGFNDPPLGSSVMRSTILSSRCGENKRTAMRWMQGFGEDISGKGRVILMSSREKELSLSSIFTNFLIEGLQGSADNNGDNICSAEEAFDYAKLRTVDMTDGSMNPTIYDSYVGDLPLTNVELPPMQPQKPVGPTTGNTITTYTYSTSSKDPEGDRIKYFVDWGDDTSEWTNLYLSEEAVSLSHSWNTEGTYNVKVKPQDEHGAEGRWSEKIGVTMVSESTVDQRQTESYIVGNTVNNNLWWAQSFKPTLDILSKVELELFSEGPDYPIYVSIRSDLQGDDLTELAFIVETTGYRTKWYMETKWIEFDLPDIEITSGQTYYIVCRCYSDESKYNWMFGNDDPYPEGDFYYSHDQGENWHESEYKSDFCFVTYG